MCEWKIQREVVRMLCVVERNIGVNFCKFLLGLYFAFKCMNCVIK